MNYKKKIFDKLNRVTDAAKDGLSRLERSEAVNKIKSVSESSLHSLGTKVEEYSEDRTSWLGGDRISELRDSANPLIQLENQKVSKHAQYAAIYFATAAGIFANATEVTRFTRDLMDSDSAAIQVWLRRVFNPEEALAISAWMDAAPGYALSGGWAHRLHHGHDLDAMMEVYGQYGAVGTIEWANHVWARDFWTPHGVPYLPAGSGSVYDWLVEQGVSPSTAMSVLSINAAEAASGLFLLLSGKRLISGVQTALKRRDALKCFKQVNELIADNNHRAAIELVEESEISSKFEEVPGLRLQLALTCLQQSYSKSDEFNAEWGHIAFNISKDLCKIRANTPESVPYHGGTQVSFQAVSAQILASSYASHVQIENVSNISVFSSIQAGIQASLKTAEKQLRKRISPRRKELASYRPFSAATNLIIALNLSINCGSLNGSRFEPIPIRRKLVKVLQEAELELPEGKEFIDGILRNIETTYPTQA